jgi:hypothetical protein
MYKSHNNQLQTPPFHEMLDLGVDDINMDFKAMMGWYRME